MPSNNGKKRRSERRASAAERRRAVSGFTIEVVREPDDQPDICKWCGLPKWECEILN